MDCRSRRAIKVREVVCGIIWGKQQAHCASLTHHARVRTATSASICVVYLPWRKSKVTASGNFNVGVTRRARFRRHHLNVDTHTANRAFVTECAPPAPSQRSFSGSAMCPECSAAAMVISQFSQSIEFSDCHEAVLSATSTRPSLHLCCRSIPKIKYEGPASKNPLAFSHYDANEVRRCFCQVHVRALPQSAIRHNVT